MSNQVLTATQYGLLVQMEQLLATMDNQNEAFHELVNDLEIFSGNLADIQGDISRIDIFGFVQRYNAGELKEVGCITISNNSGVIIIEAESDYVFGYMPIGEEKHFFLSEIEYELEDPDHRELDEEEEGGEETEYVPVFTIGDDGLQLNLNQAMRI